MLDGALNQCVTVRHCGHTLGGGAAGKIDKSSSGLRVCDDNCAFLSPPGPLFLVSFADGCVAICVPCDGLWHLRLMCCGLCCGMVVLWFVVFEIVV